MLRRQSKVLAIECFGSRASITVSHASMLSQLGPALPPVWRRCEPIDLHARFVLERIGTSGNFRLARDEQPLVDAADLQTTLGFLDSALRACIAVNAPEHIFVHAGAVEHRGKAIILPGESFTGKSTLVDALVRKGAGYMSDEYAVIERDGRVRPYGRPISLRDDGQRVGSTDLQVPTLGGRSTTEALRVGMIVDTSYRPGGSWNPQRLESGVGALRLLAHAVPARARPAQSVSAVRLAARDSVVLEGTRGDADETAAALLEAVWVFYPRSE